MYEYVHTNIHMYGMYLYGQDDFMSSIALSVMEKFNTPGMYDGLSRLDLQVVSGHITRTKPARIKP
jgi:hypothetical protein